MNLSRVFILIKNHGPLLQLLNENVWWWGPGILVSPISVGDSPVSELSRISRIQTLYVSWHRLHRRECLMCILLILKKHSLQQPTTLPVWWSWTTFVTLLTSNWRKQFDHSFKCVLSLFTDFYFKLLFKNWVALCGMVFFPLETLSYSTFNLSWLLVSSCMIFFF